MKYFETKKDSLEETISKAINEKPDSSNELKEVRVKNYKNEPNFFVNDKKDTLDKVSKRDGYGETDLAQYLGQKTGKDPEEIYFDGNDLVYGAKTIVRNARKQPVDKLLAKVKTVRNEYQPNIKESKMGAFFLDMQIDANEMSERDFIKKYKGEMGMTARELKDLYREMTESFSKMNAKDLEEKAGKYLKYSDLLLQKGRLMAKNKNTTMIDREIEKEKKRLGIKDEVVREATGDKEKYQAFFNKAMKKFGVDSPAELKGDKKKEFFNYVDKNYKGEKSEAVKTLIGKLKEWSFSTNAKKVEEKQKVGVDEKSQKEVDEQLTAMNQRKTTMRDALRQVWSGQEAKNPFDNGQKVKKERKDFAKGAKAATGEPAAKVEIDPKIKD